MYTRTHVSNMFLVLWMIREHLRASIASCVIPAYTRLLESITTPACCFTDGPATALPATAPRSAAPTTGTFLFTGQQIRSESVAGRVSDLTTHQPQPQQRRKRKRKKKKLGGQRSYRLGTLRQR